MKYLHDSEQICTAVQNTCLIWQFLNSLYIASFLPWLFLYTGHLYGFVKKKKKNFK